MTRAWFLPAAVADVEDARDWYEAQRPGLGAEFVDAVDAAITRIVDFPDAHPVVHRRPDRTADPVGDETTVGGLPPQIASHKATRAPHLHPNRPIDTISVIRYAYR